MCMGTLRPGVGGPAHMRLRERKLKWGLYDISAGGEIRCLEAAEGRKVTHGTIRRADVQ